MKKSNLILGIVYVFVGLMFLAAFLLLDTRLDSLLIGFASGAMASGVVITGKYFYWNRPGYREQYEEKLSQERIELHDELQVKLRDRTGRYTYLLGLLAVSISIVVFSVLGKYEIISQTRIIILYLGGYLIFQLLAFYLIFYRLRRKYEL